MEAQLEYPPGTGRLLRFLDTEGRSPTTVRHQLQEERVVHVVLEPGDATRYDLLLVQHDHRIYLLYLREGGWLVEGGAAAHEAGEAGVGAWDFGAHIKNAWTREVLAHYLNLITRAED